MSLRGRCSFARSNLPIELGIASSQRTLLATTCSLWLNRIACIYPGLQTAEQRRYICVAFLYKIERHTGAGVFIKSGAIRDDPLAFIKVWTRCLEFEVAKIKRTFNVACLIR